MKRILSTLITQFICFTLIYAQEGIKPTKTLNSFSSCNTNVNYCDLFSRGAYNLSGFNTKSFTSITNNSTCYNVAVSPNYGCLYTSLNQHWYVFQAKSIGNISFSISSSNSTDIDGAIFKVNNSNLSNFCSSTENTPISCDYSSSSTINLNFNNSSVGDFYILLITNYGNTHCQFTISPPTSGQVDMFEIVDTNSSSNSLAACYSFESSLIDSVSLSSGIPFNPINYATDRNGKLNSAVYLNGYNKINIPAANLLNNNYTHSVWFNLEQIPPLNSFLPLFSIGGTAGDQYSGLIRDYLSYYSNGLVYPLLGSYYQYSDAIAHFHPSSIQTNVWYNLVSVKSSDSLIIYLNGIELSRKFDAYTPYYSNSLAALGGRTSNNSQFFQGTIDDVMIFNTALNKDQVASLYHLNNCQYNQNPCDAFVKVNGNFNGISEQASMTLETQNVKIQGGINEFSAGKSILLSPGFEVNQGAVFKTRIGGCL